MDLIDTSCVITYLNANGECKIYIVPFYDIYTFAKEGKMLIPWCLDANVASTAGPVTFAIQFYKIGTIINDSGIFARKLMLKLVGTGGKLTRSSAHLHNALEFLLFQGLLQFFIYSYSHFFQLLAIIFSPY